MKGNYFDQIAGAVKLDSRVSVYVPSTTDTDKPTDNREQVEKVAAKLSAMFGRRNCNRGARLLVQPVRRPRR